MSELSVPFEAAIYDEAILFRQSIEDIAAKDIDDASEQIKRRVRDINNFCGYLGLSLTIVSAEHRIDWSFGETDNEAAHELVLGTFGGMLIGFGALPHLNPLSHEYELALSTVLSSHIHEADIDHYREVLVVTPILNSEITLLTD